MKLTCSKCYGNKTYRGMGSMIIKCEPCKGTGQIDVDFNPAQTVVESVPESQKTVAKGKRNAKEKASGSQGKAG